MDHDYLIKLIDMGENQNILVYDSAAKEGEVTKRFMRAIINSAMKHNLTPTKLIIDYCSLVDSFELYKHYIPEYENNLCSVYHLDNFYIMGMCTKFIYGLDRSGINTTYLDYYLNKAYPNATNMQILPSNGYNMSTKYNLVVLECDHGKSAILGTY